MGLLTVIKKAKRKEKEMRILIVGLDNAGKTTIVRRLNGEEDISMICPTLGFNIQTLEFKGYKLNIWDVGGQKSLRPFWRNYFEATDAIVWVVDSADRSRLEDCKRELDVLLMEERLSGATLLLLANKQDVGGALTVEEIGQVLDFSGISATRRHVRACGCSAVTGGGLRDGFAWLVEDVAARVYLYSN
mmetsp:Transcript_9184/g.17254  ORF Transcript_9184/g.17254 Transcript_9184/m.17254 type:complete len:189 (-) Transcript_9184:364-930(-)